MDVEKTKFRSPTFGELTFNEMFKNIIDYVKKCNNGCEIMVGTDSQNRFDTKVVIVICVYVKGHGGRYFYLIERVKRIKDLRTKIYYETNLSIEIAKVLNDKLYNESDVEYIFSIHSDIGRKGQTSKLINDIVGWIEAEGFKCYIKPNSYVASTIADRLSK